MEHVDKELRDTIDRLVLLLISQPRKGWEEEYEELTHRVVDRLSVPAGGESDD